MNPKFKYYNHALMPNIPDYEALSFTKAELKQAFKENKKAYFLRYTSNYDCDFITDWWYVINDKGLAQRKKSNNFKRKYNKVMRLTQCMIIDFETYKKEIKEVGVACINEYKNYGKHIPSFVYLDKMIIGCFSKEENILIGFCVLEKKENIIYLKVEKTHPNYRHLLPSFSLNTYIIENIVDYGKGEYLSNGERNISHITKHNDFLIESLGFRKAYCQLHIKYRSMFFSFIIVVLKCFKPLLKLLDNNHFIHLINGVLLMDSIASKQKKVFNNYES